MDPRLQEETEKLIRSWQQHDAAMLRDYLVQDVEDPRLNVQSILTRHFLIEELFGSRFGPLQEHELRFGLVANWILRLRKEGNGPEEFHAIVHALERRADDAEGLEIPGFVSRAWAAFSSGEPAGLATATAAAEPGAFVAVPNYVAGLLLESDAGRGASRPGGPALNIFMELWREVLAHAEAGRLSVLEPACGSANDYRYLEACGLARLIDYTGFDLSAKNVANAAAMFPAARFVQGNALATGLADKAFDLAFVHDLFEHLSVQAMEAAVAELCRVTRRGFSLGFFSLHEGDEHVLRPSADYHFNTLALEPTRRLFEDAGFGVQVLHIGTFLREVFGCDRTHNANAYTLVGRAR